MNRRVGGILFLLAVIATAALIAFSGIAPRIRARQALREETNLLAAVPVTIVHPRRASPAE